MCGHGPLATAGKSGPGAPSGGFVWFVLLTFSLAIVSSYGCLACKQPTAMERFLWWLGIADRGSPPLEKREGRNNDGHLKEGWE
jgi:hypothetical protein